MKSKSSDGVVRFSVSVPKELAKQLDQMTREKGYDNRSLAVADMVRAQLVEHRQNLGNQDIAGTAQRLDEPFKDVVEAIVVGARR